MANQLHQINMVYVHKEDRLLMRTSTQAGKEFRLWVTRRYALLLLEVLNKEMNNLAHIPKKSGTDDQRPIKQQPETQQSTERQAETQTEDKNKKSYPLGEAGFLAFGLKASPADNASISLQFFPEEGQGITLNLDFHMLCMLRDLLQQSVKSADWFLQDTDEAPVNIH